MLAGQELTPETKTAWQDIVQQIERFKAADGYLLSVLMRNFNIPYPLKQYIDIIDIKFINAQPMDAMGREVQEQKINATQSLAKQAINWF